MICARKQASRTSTKCVSFTIQAFCRAKSRHVGVSVPGMFLSMRLFYISNWLRDLFRACVLNGSLGSAERSIFLWSQADATSTLHWKWFQSLFNEYLRFLFLEAQDQDPETAGQLYTKSQFLKSCSRMVMNKRLPREERSIAAESRQVLEYPLVSCKHRLQHQKQMLFFD
jgi:hypothetical protein